MSKHETPLTRAYWEEVGGMLIEEYCAVPSTPMTGRRMLDGVIILDEEHKIAGPGERYPALGGCDLISVQTKATRIDHTLAGQAIFSPKLIRLTQTPRSIRAVAIYTKDDPVLRELMLAHDVECRQVGNYASSIADRRSKPRVSSLLDEHEQLIPETVTRHVTLVPHTKGQPRHVCEALITDDGEAVNPEHPDLSGRGATAIISGGLGMWMTGRALIALDHLDRCGVANPRVVMLAPKRDAAIQATLTEYPAVTVIVPPFGGAAV